MTRRRWLVLAAAALAAVLSLLYAWWARRSGPPATAPPSVTTAAEDAVSPVDPRVLEHFLATAFDAEAPSVTLHKWADNVRMGVTGSPSFDDRAEVEDLARDLRPHLGRVDVTLVETEPNLEFRFLPLDEIGEIEPDHVRRELGHVRTWRDGKGRIERARILIASGDEIPQYMRTHLVQDLGARALGLQGRPEEPWESALSSQSNWMVQSLPPLDREAIGLLYRDELQPGMTPEEAVAALDVPAPPEAVTGTPGTPPGRGAGPSSAGSGS